MTADPGLPFRATDPFLMQVLAARLLGAALDSGVIDRLIAGPAAPLELERLAGLAPRGRALMLAGLQAAGVASVSIGSVGLTPAFRAALPYRDLLEARLRFADLVLPDVGGLTLPLLGAGDEFLARSATFELFRYDRAKHRDGDNRAATERWVAFTTALTRYEAAGLLSVTDLSATRRLLDVGGNSGELVRRLTEAHPQLDATVFDLPVVCDIGRDHLAATPQAGRVAFVEGDLREDALPGGMDAVVLKSVLHDWPDDFAGGFVTKAAQALAPGGRLYIFERCPFDFGAGLPPYHAFPNLMFLHFLREPGAYRPMLDKAGLVVEHEHRVVLDMPFFLLVARRP